MIKESAEIVTPERIVVLHLEPPEHRFTHTTTLGRQAEGRHLEWRIVFDSPEEDRRVRHFVVAGNEQNFDRLEALLRRVGSG